MELIAEILLQILIGIIQLLGELLIQMVGEMMVELIRHHIKNRFLRLQPIPPIVATLAYFVLGAVAGLASLWLIPTLFISTHWLRIVNLVLTPIASGMLMFLIGALRQRHDQELIQLNRFWYGFCFALSMAIVRFTWAT